MKRIILFFCILFSNVLFSQDVLSGAKIWTGFSVGYTINKKTSITLENINSLNAYDGSFTFNQLSILGTRAFKKNIALEFGYGNNLYKWLPSYNVYNLRTSSFGTVMFHNIELNINHKFKISNTFRVKQELGGQFYIPSLEKYQLRFQYRIKIFYYKKENFLRFSPFIEPIIYYYLNGIPISYKNDQNEIIAYKSPNGFHRYRLKAGVKISPFKKLSNLSFIFYYTLQKEFNIHGLGHDLNVISNNKPSLDYNNIPNKTNNIYPFNNYSIIGFHILYDIN